MEADGGKRHIRAVAFVSAPEMHIAEGLPPPDRWGPSGQFFRTEMQNRSHEVPHSWVGKYRTASLLAHLQRWRGLCLRTVTLGITVLLSKS